MVGVLVKYDGLNGRLKNDIPKSTSMKSHYNSHCNKDAILSINTMRVGRFNILLLSKVACLSTNTPIKLINSHERRHFSDTFSTLLRVETSSKFPIF